MNKEEKQILLIDLSARYPYGVIIHSIWDYQELSGRIKRKETVRTMESYDFCDYWNCKPYLRPMSSMTEEEKKELKSATCPEGTGYFDEQYLICPMSHFGEHVSYDFMSDILNWLNAHHFDYRNLIEKGLAIEVTEENNPYKD